MINCIPRRYGTRRSVPTSILSWRMNEVTGSVIDYSGNGYTGRVDGAPTRAVSVYGSNKGIQLTASGHGVSIAKSECPLVVAALESQTCTISMVFENSTAGTANPCPFVIWNNAAGGFTTLRLGNDKPGYANWSSSAGSQNYGSIQDATVTGLKIITYVRTPSEGRLYVDGILVATKVHSPSVFPATSSSDRIQVGGHLNFPGSYQYRGKASDLNIWNVALTPDEVTALANQQGRTLDQRPSNVTTGVILNLRMDDTGSTAIDYSGNGYNGRIDGTPNKGVAMGNGNAGIQLKSLGDGVSLDSTTLAPVINAIRTGSYSQSIVIRNMGWSGAHSPIPFVIWQSSLSGREVTLFVDYVPGSFSSWLHRAGWDSASATDIGNLSFSYAPSSFDSQTFHLTYVWDDVTRTKSLYRDGVLVTSAVLSQDYTVNSPSSERVQVGGHLNFPGSYQYYGKISDLIIWDRALSAADVSLLYAQNGRV